MEQQISQSPTAQNIAWLFLRIVEKNCNFASNKIDIMKTITLRYDSKNVFAQKLLEVMLASGAFSIELESKNELQKSIEEAHKGNYFVAKNAKDAIAKCLV